MSTPTHGSCSECPPRDLSVIAEQTASVAIPRRHILSFDLLNLAAVAPTLAAFAFKRVGQSMPLRLGEPPAIADVSTSHIPQSKQISQQHSLGLLRRTMSFVPSRAPASAIWGASDPPLTGNVNRQKKAAHHAAWGPATGASMPRAPHRPYSGVQRSTQQKQSLKSKDSSDAPKVTIDFAIYPLPLNSIHLNVDMDYPELYPSDPRVFDSSDFWLGASDNSLTISFPVPTFNPPNADHSFYSDLNTAVLAHASDHGLRFPLSDSPVPNTRAYDTPEWHAIQLMTLQWCLLKVGSKPRNGQLGRVLSVAEVSWSQYTAAGLKKHGAGLKNPASGETYYLLAPRYGPLQGSLARSLLPHRCFPLRVLQPLTPSPDPIDCYPDCPPILGAAPAGPSTVQSSSRETRTLRRQLNEAPAALFTDDSSDDEDLREAMARSLADPAPVAGPSHRPLPQPPTTTRARSAELSPPPASRRRLNPPIDLTRSPSPPEISRPTYRTTTSWANSFASVLSRDVCRVRGPTTALTIEAMLAHILSFFGGPPHQPASIADTVLIEPTGHFGLLAANNSWTVGQSMGAGVVKNTMTELMNLVFSDNAVWTRTGDVYVIEITPVDIPSDAGRLRCLKAYGYACMLHLVLLKSLPVALSAVFAYALLQPDSELAVFEDLKFLRAIAPEETRQLQYWPADRAEFIQNKDDRNLKGLTGLYFNKLPDAMVSYSPDSLAAHRMHAARQLMFGSATPFAQSPDIQAFVEGFNGRLGASSSTTLSQASTFGGSMKSLMLQMLSGRVKSAEDVIKRLRWESSEVPALLPAEELYKTAFLRYLRGKGIVKHRLLVVNELTDAEKRIAVDDPSARTQMFLMATTGTQQLLRAEGTIDLNFLERHFLESPDTVLGDPVQNPDGWPYHLSIAKVHTCFNGVDLPLHGVSMLLQQPLPADDSTSTDFDLYQYLMWRPTTRFAEFGGIVSVNIIN
ncbi:hypothetical protein C8R44DRAFT_885466 [Mycena epipterygia]|nr:hypothetical protein C8R44DRAFT_885466 [Mycena epipterygia]